MPGVSGRQSLLVSLSFGPDLGRSLLQTVGLVLCPSRVGVGGRMQSLIQDGTRPVRKCRVGRPQQPQAADTVVVDATFAEGTADVKDETERSGQGRILRGEETCTEPQLKPGGEGRGEGRGEDNWREGQDR